MQLIADMAGQPKANLHCYYFATKEELYRKVAADLRDLGSTRPRASTRRRGRSRGSVSAIDANDGRPAAIPGSKVSASEVMHGAPVIQDYLETTPRDWTEGRAAVIRRWIAEGKMAPVDPHHLLHALGDDATTRLTATRSRR